MSLRFWSPLVSWWKTLATPESFLARIAVVTSVHASANFVFSSVHSDYLWHWRPAERTEVRLSPSVAIKLITLAGDNPFGRRIIVPFVETIRNIQEYCLKRLHVFTALWSDTFIPWRYDMRLRRHKKQSFFVFNCDCPFSILKRREPSCVDKEPCTHVPLSDSLHFAKKTHASHALLYFPV